MLNILPLVAFAFAFALAIIFVGLAAIKLTLALVTAVIVAAIGLGFAANLAAVDIKVNHFLDSSHSLPDERVLRRYHLLQNR